MQKDWRDAIEAIREKVDLVRVVEGYTKLKRSGSGFTGLCPFHNEKTPSFHVHPVKGFYKCFGCGASGDIFSFVMDTRKLDFRAAVQELAEETGIVLETSDSSSDNQLWEEKKQAFSIWNYAIEWYQQVFVKSSQATAARDYFFSRGFTENDAQRLKIGYSPTETALAEVLKKRGFSCELAARYGLLNFRNGTYSDRQYNRLLFPISDSKGKYVGLGARIFNSEASGGHPDAKYINTPDTPLFHKGSLLYGLHESTTLRSSQSLIIGEGYFDVARIVANDLPACAPMGTAMSTIQTRLIKRYWDKVILAFDGDPAGLKACYKSLPLIINEGIKAFVYELPANSDLDSFFANKSTQVVREELQDSVPGIEFIIENEIGQCVTVQDKQEASENIKSFLKEIRDPVLVDAAVQLVQNHLGTSFVYRADSATPSSKATHQAPIRRNEITSKKPTKLEAVLLQNADKPERREELLDHEIFDLLSHEAQEYLRAEAPFPETAQTRTDISAPELNNDEWYNLLKEANKYVQQHFKKYRRDTLIQLLSEARLNGQEARIKLLERELQEVLITP